MESEKRVQDKRIDGIPLKVTHRKDGHGFAIWQVVSVAGDESKTSEGPGNGELLLGALTRMGFRPAEADHAVSALGARVETESLPDLVRAALGVLRQRPMLCSKPKRG